MFVIFEVDKGAYFVLVLCFCSNMLVEEVFGLHNAFLLTSPGIVVSSDFSVVEV